MTPVPTPEGSKPVDLAAVERRIEEDRRRNVLGFDICDNCGHKPDAQELIDHQGDCAKCG